MSAGPCVAQTSALILHVSVNLLDEVPDLIENQSLS
jgi:hypothetical protein